MEQYIIFRVARLEFAMKATRVRGLLPIHEVIPVEAVENWVSGISSLHGREFPVVDLRGKLGIEPGAHGRQPCIVVVEVDGERLLGFVADRVSEILTPRQRDFRDGMVSVNGRMRRVLDASQIMTKEELLNFRRLTPSP